MDIGTFLSQQYTQKHCTIITANHRLTSYLRSLYNRYHTNQGHQVWPTLDILPLWSWLKRQFDWLENAPTLLSTQQTISLWQQVIADSDQAFPLLNAHATAYTANQAWEYINLWHIPLNDLTRYPGQDYSAFYHWGHHFQKRCQQIQAIDPSQVIPYLHHQLANWHSQLPENLVLAGFDNLSPALTNLLQAMHNQNTNISTLLLDNPGPAAQYQTAFEDREQEMHNMACWALNKLQQHPQCRIGCVVTDLENQRQRCQRLFTEVLSSPSMRQHFQTDELRSVFNISMGQRFSDYPLVHMAMFLLQLAHREPSLDEISYLLRSPFISGYEVEMLNRSLLDARLRQHNPQNPSLRFILTQNSQAMAQNDQTGCPILHKMIHNALECMQSMPDKLAPSQWSDHIKQLLAAWGWPGDRTLTSFEYQQYHKWLQLYPSLASLDAVIDQLSYTECSQKINHITQQMIFQPQTPQAPIQILGPLEAAGIHFDTIWVSGMEDDKWPPPLQPNPFIPLTLQRQQGVPHTVTQQEKNFCQRLLNRFSHSADHIQFSYITQEDDQPKLASPFLSNTNYREPDTLARAAKTPWPFQYHHVTTLEVLQEAEYVTVPQLHGKVSGGSQLFKDMAECPFRAFAYYRMNAYNLDQPSIGVEPQEKGRLLHKVMAQFWHYLGDQRQLWDLSQSELSKLIQHTIEQCVKPSESHSDWSKTLNQLEKQRIHDLVWQWLEHEKQRPPFKVQHIEKRATITFSGLQVDLQLDRVDQIDDGTHWIIDYKTGQTNIKEWFGTKPSEPQLPLYSLSHDEPIGALLIAQMRTNDMTFKGCSRHPINLKGVYQLTQIKHPEIEVNWQQQNQNWHHTFDRLAKAFQQGYVIVEPKDPPRTCQYCDLHPLCRIYEKIHEAIT